MKKETQSAKKKRNYRFNFIDVLLILVILAVVSALAVILISDRVEVADTQVQTTDIIYELEFSSTYSDYKKLIQIGDTVTNLYSLEPIGEVLNVVASDVSYEGHSAQDGSSVLSTLPDRIRLVVTIRATAEVSEQGTYSVSGSTLFSGRKVSIRVPKFEGTGLCISVKEASENE